MLLPTLLALLPFAGPPAKPRPVAVAVDRPATATRNAHYVSNRAPLAPQAFVKLPIGSVKPGGWLRENLVRQADGLAGNLGQISVWLTKKNNAWLSADGTGEWGWEELPYWLKGYGDMAYLLGRPEMRAETKVWIEGTLSSQRPNGDFGPVVRRKGKRDLWAQMLMLFCLQSAYEHAPDPRILTLMTRYFKWQLTLPDEDFLEDYWENSRGGDNLYSVYWLYNRTGEPWLLDLATKIDRNTANWRQMGNLPNWHNVNVAQCFREPATYALQSGNKADLAATYANFRLIRQRYGQVPGGMWGGDENSRPGYTDPRQAIETCGMVEQMASDELLFQFTGDPLWAENCEDVAFNTLPAAFMPDYRSLRYLTAPNMVVSDAKNHAPGIQNDGPYLMMNPFSSRCCQHNHGNGWAYYAENAWLATPDNGLAAVFFGENEVSAKVADGQPVTIRQQTHYPFEEQIRLTLQTAKPVRFPLYLRVPTWCAAPKLRVNGQPVTVSVKPGQYLKVTHLWRSGDRVTLDLPMRLTVRRWTANANSASVNYGPLTFSLKIQEAYRKENSATTAQHDSGWQPSADPSKWPAYEIFPGSAWNYGLVLPAAKPETAFRVVKRPWPADNFPFTPPSAPIELRATARRLPGWGLDQYGLCATLPPSPVKTDAPAEEVTLVPMGAARLRISAFPVTK
jgi:hypothetical protein